MLAQPIPGSETEARVKGFALRGLLKYVKNSGYPGGVQRLLATMPEHERSHFSEQILSSAWCPYSAFTSLLEAIDREIGQGDYRHLHRVGEFSGHEDAGTIFKVVLSLASIERVIRRADMFWHRYCDRGSFEIVEASRGHLVLRLQGFPEIHRGHCELIAGWIKGLGLCAGATEAEATQTRCVCHGDPYCEFTAHWS